MCDGWFYNDVSDDIFGDGGGRQQSRDESDEELHDDDRETLLREQLQLDDDSLPGRRRAFICNRQTMTDARKLVDEASRLTELRLAGEETIHQQSLKRKKKMSCPASEGVREIGWRMEFRKRREDPSGRIHFVVMSLVRIRSLRHSAPCTTAPK